MRGAHPDFLQAPKLLDLPVAEGGDALVLDVKVLLKVLETGVAPVDVAQSAAEVGHLVLPIAASSSPSTAAAISSASVAASAVSSGVSVAHDWNVVVVRGQEAFCRGRGDLKAGANKNK